MTQKEFKCSGTNIPAVTPVNTNPNESSGCQPSDKETDSGDFICLVLVLIIIVILLIALGIWCSSSSDSEKNPEFHVYPVSILLFNASSNNHITSSSSSYDNWNMSTSFVAKNNINKKTSLFYNMYHAFLFYEKQLLSETNIGEFYLGAKEQTVINATFTMSLDTTHFDHWVVDAMDGYKKLQGEGLKFNVLVKARATVNPGSVTNVKEKWMTVKCKDIKVQFVSDNVSGTKRTMAAEEDENHCKVVLNAKEDENS